MHKNDGAGPTQAGLFWISLHVFTLSSFAVAQPLYDLLGSSPEFFVANDVGPGVLLAAVFIVALGIPAAIFAVIAVIRLVSPRAGTLCYAMIVAALSALIVLPPLNTIDVLCEWGAIVIAASVSNLFNLGRHLVRAEQYRNLRVSAFGESSRVVA